MSTDDRDDLVGDVADARTLTSRCRGSAAPGRPRGHHLRLEIDAYDETIRCSSTPTSDGCINTHVSMCGRIDL